MTTVFPKKLFLFIRILMCFKCIWKQPRKFIIIRNFIYHNITRCSFQLIRYRDMRLLAIVYIKREIMLMLIHNCVSMLDRIKIGDRLTFCMSINSDIKSSVVLSIPAVLILGICLQRSQ